MNAIFLVLILTRELLHARQLMDATSCTRINIRVKHMRRALLLGWIVFGLAIIGSSYIAYSALQDTHATWTLDQYYTSAAGENKSYKQQQIDDSTYVHTAC